MNNYEPLFFSLQNVKKNKILLSFLSNFIRSVKFRIKFNNENQMRSEEFDDERKKVLIGIFHDSQIFFFVKLFHFTHHSQMSMSPKLQRIVKNFN